MRYIIVVWVFWSNFILACAAPSFSLPGIPDQLLEQLPHLRFIYDPHGCLSDSKCFNGRDYERDDLIAYASMIRAYNGDRLQFLCSALNDTQRLNLTKEELYERIKDSPYVDEDRIGQTFNCACAYLRPGTLRDVVQPSLIVAAHRYVLRSLFNERDCFYLPPPKMSAELLEDILIRCIRLEQKSIKIAVRGIEHEGMKDALVHAVSRGVDLEIVIDDVHAQYLCSSRLSYKIAWVHNSFIPGSCVLFEKNIDDEAIVVAGIYGEPTRESLRLKAVDIFKGQQMYDKHVKQFAQAVSCAILPVRNVFALPSKRELLDEKEESTLFPNSASQEVKMLMRVLDEHYTSLICSPIEQDSADAVKRQRKG